jgi:hypothetical protein
MSERLHSARAWIAARPPIRIALLAAAAALYVGGAGQLEPGTAASLCEAGFAAGVLLAAPIERVSWRLLGGSDLAWLALGAGAMALIFWASLALERSPAQMALFLAAITALVICTKLATLPKP